MTDFIVTIKNTGHGQWPVPDKESGAAIKRWASSQKLGESFIFRILKRMPTRRDKHHALYRLRNSILAPALDTDADSLHDYIKQELNMTEENTIAGKTYTRLRSQKEFSVAEMSLMFEKQDELAKFANDGREPQDYLILPGAE
jgi:hypothetical protein